MLGWLILFNIPVFAKITEYNLEIARNTVNITGNTVKKITVNGSLPAPTLQFQEGDEAVIHVTNRLNEDSSIHWHGLLLPGAMDGVPNFNGFKGIKPNETFTYKFPLRQAGTYWYHAHSMGQEQDGLYGSIIIAPKDKDPIGAERDYIILISDYTDEESKDIHANLKKHSAYYNHTGRTIGDFFTDIQNIGFQKAWKNATDWGQMRMSPTDLADVSGYTFLINGQKDWSGLFNKGERIRLRFINASSMSFYDVRIPNLKMSVVQADGQNVEPVTVDEFRFGVGETYDVIIEPKEDKAYTIIAEPIDRTGFALGTLATHKGMKGEMPKHRKRSLLTMADMGMSHEGSGHDMAGMDMSTMNHAAMGHDMSAMAQDDAKSGWADADTPKGHKALDYKDLQYLGTQPESSPPTRDIIVTLGGNMERYIWTLNGKKYEDAEPILLKYGERVRLKFINETMMAHPMHLHGMFVQLENGQPMDKIPNKHTIIVPPGKSYSAFLTANEVGEWAFHCHLLFHMMSGMMNKVVVAKLLPDALPASVSSTSKAGEHHHAE